MIARCYSLAGAVILAGCGSTTNGAVEQIAPASGNAAVIDCLVKQVADMGYRVMRKDPGAGFLEAERRDPNFKADSPKQYAEGDRLSVQRGKGDKSARPLVLTMTSFRMDWLANGGTQSLGAPTATGKADLDKLVAACGPNGVALPAAPPPGA